MPNNFLEERLHKLQTELENEREKKVEEINAQIASLKSEEERIAKRLQEINILEGKEVANLQGNYEPKLIEEFTELSLQAKLFNFPKPNKSVY